MRISDWSSDVCSSDLHYLAGRAFGVRADVFSIGFGRELFGWTDRRGTRWKVAVLPLGGYVKFAGDMSPASTPTPNGLRCRPKSGGRHFRQRSCGTKRTTGTRGREGISF